MLTIKILQANQKSKNNTIYIEGVLRRISGTQLDNHCISSDEYIILASPEGSVKRFKVKLANQISGTVNQ